MSAFDDLTLGEVEQITTVALNGTSISEADPLMLAGGVMWMTQRRTQPELDWDAFKSTVKMGDIKSFSIQMEADALDPQGVQHVPLN